MCFFHSGISFIIAFFTSNPAILEDPSLPAAKGSCHDFMFPVSDAAASASLACLSVIFCSLLSLERAPAIIAAWASDPSGFLTILTGLRSFINLPCPLRNGASSSTISISMSSSSESAFASMPFSSSKSGNSDLSITLAAIICFNSHLSGLDMRTFFFKGPSEWFILPPGPNPGLSIPPNGAKLPPVAKPGRSGFFKFI